MEKWRLSGRAAIQIDSWLDATVIAAKHPQFQKTDPSSQSFLLIGGLLPILPSNTHNFHHSTGFSAEFLTRAVL